MVEATGMFVFLIRILIVHGGERTTYSCKIA
jgi:hypothetical protein